MSKKISIAFVLLLILGVAFWQLPWICATFGMPLPQSLAFLKDYQLNSPKAKSDTSSTSPTSPNSPLSSSPETPSTSPVASSNGVSAQSSLSEPESRQVTVNKQPVLPGDVFTNTVAAVVPDPRLSSPLPRENVQAPVIPAPQMLNQRTSDGSRVTGCLVSAMDIYGEAKVPAQEPGVILELTKTVGMMVNKGEAIGKIDDSQPQLQLKAATAEAEGARLKAMSSVDEQYAMKAAEVARAKLEKLYEANKSAPGSVSMIEILETKLTVERAQLEAQRAGEERTIAQFTVAAKTAEADAAKAAIIRRQLLAPVSGVIKEIVPHIGEWVKGGDVVFHVINMERLQVTGTYDLLNDKKIGRSELLNREVVFEFEYKKGDIQRVPAKIVYVDPTNEYASTLVKVKAEIINRYDETTKDWLVHPNNYGDLLLFPDAR